MHRNCSTASTTPNPANSTTEPSFAPNEKRLHRRRFFTSPTGKTAIVPPVARHGNLRIEDIMEAFVTSIVLIVAVVPEGLPTIVAISLSINIIKLSRENALVKKLIASETIGAINVTVHTSPALPNRTAFAAPLHHIPDGLSPFPVDNTVNSHPFPFSDNHLPPARQTCIPLPSALAPFAIRHRFPYRTTRIHRANRTAPASCQHLPSGKNRPVPVCRPAGCIRYICFGWVFFLA